MNPKEKQELSRPSFIIIYIYIYFFLILSQFQFSRRIRFSHFCVTLSLSECGAFAPRAQLNPRQERDCSDSNNPPEPNLLCHPYTPWLSPAHASWDRSSIGSLGSAQGWVFMLVLAWVGGGGGRVQNKQTDLIIHWTNYCNYDEDTIQHMKNAWESSLNERALQNELSHNWQHCNTMQEIMNSK